MRSLEDQSALEKYSQVVSTAFYSSAVRKTVLAMSDNYNLGNKQLLQLTGKAK